MPLQRLACAMTLLSLALIIHGSCYPWRWQPPQQWGLAFQQLVSPVSLSSGTGDIIGNILLFAPLSALGSWWWRAKPWWWNLLVWGLGGAVLGFALQVAQIAIPGRSPAVSDALWNGVGLALGFAFVPVVPACLRWLRERVHSPHFGAYLVSAFWLVLAWWPLLPGINSWMMRAAWRQMWNFSRLNLHDAWLQGLGVLILAHVLRQVPARSAVLLLVVLTGWLGKMLFSFTLPVNHVSNTVGWSIALALGMLIWALRRREALWLLLAIAVAAMASEGLRGAFSAPLAGAAAVQWWPFVSALGDQRVAYTLGMLIWTWWIGAGGAAALMLGARPWLLWPGITVALAALEWAQRQWPGQQADISLLFIPALCAMLLAWAERRQWWRPRPALEA